MYQNPNRKHSTFTYLFITRSLPLTECSGCEVWHLDEWSFLADLGCTGVPDTVDGCDVPAEDWTALEDLLLPTAVLDASVNSLLRICWTDGVLCGKYSTLWVSSSSPVNGQVWLWKLNLASNQWKTENIIINATFNVEKKDVLIHTCTAVYPKLLTTNSALKTLLFISQDAQECEPVIGISFSLVSKKQKVNSIKWTPV